jgi:hypothetical protein
MSKTGGVLFFFLMGVALLLNGILGERYTYGVDEFGTSSGTPAPKWFGRLMFISGGILFVAAAVLSELGFIRIR